MVRRFTQEEKRIVKYGNKLAIAWKKIALMIEGDLYRYLNNPKIAHTANPLDDAFVRLLSREYAEAFPEYVTLLEVMEMKKEAKQDREAAKGERERERGDEGEAIMKTLLILVVLSLGSPVLHA